jgi:pyruvate, water dikinase
VTTQGDHLLEALQERAKELSTIYRVNEACKAPQASLDEVFRSVAGILPAGWQYPETCFARVTAGGTSYGPADAVASPWRQAAPIRVQGEVVGTLEVFYRDERPASDEGPFLKEERRLLDAVAERLGQLLLERRLLDALHDRREDGTPSEPGGEWRIIVDFLRQTDPRHLVRISRRMINYLCWNGVAAAQDLLPHFAGGRDPIESDENRPSPRRSAELLLGVADEAFRLAAGHLSAAEIRSCIQKWIRDDKADFLLRAAENPGTSTAELAQALARFHDSHLDDRQLSRTVQVELRVSLARRFLTDDLGFVDVAKDFIDTADFFELVRHVIASPKSYGRVGGKASGLFLASQIVAKSTEFADAIGDVKIPRTWYLSSDGILDFIEFNQLDDLYDRKYLEIDQVRREYPHVIQVFKNSHFSPEIVKGLSLALDDFGDRPLIVRSSSLLEDRVGAAFSGKYKSLFLANQGPKADRLSALLDAIAEVYASVFGPDPLEYRAERGLLDVHEEMGILLQEVVGNRVGKYFLPTFAGVAFSNNEFRWSARIAREDGLVRLVPGLGTRAVDRVADDYPILVAPGKPGLRVNVTPAEVVRYAPRKVDVINLESGRFETMELDRLLEECGPEIPGVEQILSVADESGVHRPYFVDWAKKGRFIATFEPLLQSTTFLSRVRALLRVLREKTHGPVDIEFASDGRDLYLLQCRPQSFAEESAAAPIPSDLSGERVIFEARRFVSNGRVPDLTYVVYVDPEAYAALPDAASLRRVGQAVGRLNKVLPKRRFVLMGPGRWGSRGDLRLGVPVGYSDIHNTAALVEIARKRGGYVPDLSFGTHFFQDLVEASIRYLPLFPDDPEIRFRESFLRESASVLAELAPEFRDVEAVVRVIDVPKVTGGSILRLLLNADEDHAVAILASPESGVRPRASRP